MSAIVIKPDKALYKEIIHYYRRYRLSKTVPYSELTAKKDGTTITVYTSGKVMFQGNAAEQEASLWQDRRGNAGQENKKGEGEKDKLKKRNTGTAKSASSSSKSKAERTGLPKNFSQWSVLGSDEVGNGSYFGPLIVCAAYAPAEKLALLKELGVRDSKELTDSQIQKIAEALKGVLDYQLLVLTPEKYNEIQPQYNAVRMKVALHNQAIWLLLQKLAPEKPQAILMDQFVAESSYRRYVAKEKHQVQEKIYFITKGEQYHLSVAAASILARAAFVQELEKASKELGFIVPSGAGTKSDQLAAKVLQRGGMDLLGKYVKLHFANTQKAQRLAEK